MASLTDSLPDSALTRLFEAELRTGKAGWFSLPGGVSLFEKGEVADQLFLLRIGRLGVIRREDGHEPQFLGVIRPGEPAGEMSLIADAPHSANVVALRDSEILTLPRDVFFEAAESDPVLMTELARLMILRARQSAKTSTLSEPSVFGFIGVSANCQTRKLVDALADAILALGYRVTVVGAEAFHAPTAWFSNVEQAHDLVLYVAEAHDAAWKAVVGRQVDRLFRVARGGAPPPPALRAHAADPLQANALVDLILLQDADCEAPHGSQAWSDAVSPARLFHLKDGRHADIERLARVLTGQSVGLVLSGGGARAYAHIGAIRALHERHVPVDFVGGVSMGAIIAAGLAMGWDDDEMDWRIRKAFVTTSPLDDIALPLIAMVHGDKVRERLAEHFGDREIADLWLPFYCISTNLTTGSYQLHKSGKVRDALRASISLPGILPPVFDGLNVLVDGAVMKNYPADIMRSIQLGPVVGVDVSRGRSIDADDVRPPVSFWRWILSGDWRRGPPIVSVLMRSGTIRSGADLLAAREATDVLIMPNLDKVEIRDWRAFDPAIQAGYRAAIEALDKLTRPVTELRRRRSLDDPPPGPPQGPPPGPTPGSSAAKAGPAQVASVGG